MTDNPKMINKTLPTASANFESTKPYEAISDLTGSLLVPYSLAAEKANYMKTAVTVNGVTITKYYFITDRVLEIGNKLRLFLKTDVLYTYAADIKKCPAVCRRSANLYDAFIYDNQMNRYAFPANGLYNFWDSVNGYFSFSYDAFSNLILVTMG